MTDLLPFVVALALPETTFYVFDAPATAYMGSLWDGYLCEVYLPTRAGTKPAMVMGTIVHHEWYGPWEQVRCTMPALAPGRIAYGCVRSVWDDGLGGVVFSDCVTQEVFAAPSGHAVPPTRMEAVP